MESVALRLSPIEQENDFWRRRPAAHPRDVICQAVLDPEPYVGDLTTSLFGVLCAWMVPGHDYAILLYLCSSVDHLLELWQQQPAEIAYLPRVYLLAEEAIRTGLPLVHVMQKVQRSGHFTS